MVEKLRITIESGEKIELIDDVNLSQSIFYKNSLTGYVVRTVAPYIISVWIERLKTREEEKDGGVIPTKHKLVLTDEEQSNF